MRKIDKVILHCTDTKEGVDISIADVDVWHRARGWKMCGYHYLVRLDGSVERGRPVSMVGAHCKGHNKNSIGVAYVGGVKKNGTPCNTMTQAQRDTVIYLVESLAIVIGDIELCGHNDLTDAKTCPNFDVAEWWASNMVL